jgi:hypothetical protein
MVFVLQHHSVIIGADPVMWIGAVFWRLDCDPDANRNVVFARNRRLAGTYNENKRRP